MNIFMTDTCPVKSAQNLCDTHCSKMILETAQILSTAHRCLDGRRGVYVNGKGVEKKGLLLDGEAEHILYRETHVNHPSVLWARFTSGNYRWLYKHMKALDAEFKWRFDKPQGHLSGSLLPYLEEPPKNILEASMTPLPLAMPDAYQSDDVVDSYRRYIVLGKCIQYPEKFRWNNKREKPEWFSNYVHAD